MRTLGQTLFMCGITNDFSCPHRVGKDWCFKGSSERVPCCKVHASQSVYLRRVGVEVGLLGFEPVAPNTEPKTY